MKLEDLINKQNIDVDQGEVHQLKNIRPENEIVDEYHSDILEEFLNLGTPEELDQTEYDMLQQIEIPDYLVNDPELVGYPDLEMQEKIYNWAIQYLNFSEKTVLDVGAGRGDLFNVLNQFNLKSYIGIEERQALCYVGVSTHTDPRFSLINANYFNIEYKADIAFVIGTLNSTSTTTKWEDFKKMFNKLYSEINECVIFIVNNHSLDGFNDYPFNELFTNLLLTNNIPFTIDYSKFEGIYKLTIYKY
jgi:hypothetical protein